MLLLFLQPIYVLFVDKCVCALKVIVDVGTRGWMVERFQVQTSTYTHETVMLPPMQSLVTIIIRRGGNATQTRVHLHVRSLL